MAKPKLIEYSPRKGLPSEIGILVLLSTVTIGGYLLFRKLQNSPVPNDSQIDDLGRSTGVPVDMSKVYNEEVLRAKYYAFSLVVAYIQEESDFKNLIRPTSQEITKYLYKYEKELEEVNKTRFLSGNSAKGEKAAKMLAQKILSDINEERKLRSMLI